MRGDLSDNRYPGTGSATTPKIDVLIEGRRVRALIDTECTTTTIRANSVHAWIGNTSIKAFDGRDMKCRGVSNSLTIRRRLLRTEKRVVDHRVADIKAMIGMDVIRRMGAVTVDRRGLAL